MNISNINSANAAKIYAEVNKKLNSDNTAKNQKQAKAYDAAVDKGGVNISREAKSMNVLDFAKERIKLDMSADHAPADRISHLKNLVQSGGYHVSTGALAAALIEGN